jgi:curved DNA-binding protein CbpA
MSRSVDDLISQMNPKKKPEDLPKIKADKQPEKIKSTVKNNVMDYYAIIGCDKNATEREIKIAYRKKLQTYHPDKIEQTKDNILKYKLIREAGDILKDAQKRKAYDMEQKMEENPNDYISQKDGFKEFMKLQEQTMTEEDKNIAKLKFEMSKKDMNRKHGYDEEAAKNKMTKDEHNRRIEDLTMQRQMEQDEIELEHSNPFKDRKMAPVEFGAEFNKYFEKRKKIEEKKKKTGGLIRYEDIGAFNDDQDMGATIDNYEGLYGEGNFSGYNENYAGVGSGMIGDNMSDNGSDDLSIGSIEDTFDKHNKGATKESLDEIMKKEMNERMMQDKAFDNMTDVDFGSAINDKFGVSHGMGFMVGNNMRGDQRSKKKEDKTDPNKLKAYRALLKEK